MDAEQEGTETGKKDSTRKGGEQDEVPDAKHGTAAVEGCLVPWAGLYIIH